MLRMILIAAAMAASPTTVKDIDKSTITLDDAQYQEAWQQATTYELDRVYFEKGDIRLDRGDTPNQQHPFKFPGGRDTHAGSLKLRYPANPEAINVGFESGLPVWEWPDGTTYFELHTLSDGQPFELRARMKVSGEWEASRFRPIYDHKHLEDLVGRRVLYEIVVKQATSEHLPLTPRNVAVIGKIDRGVLQQREWKSVKDVDWIDGQAIDVTTRSSDSIVPQGYDGWIVAHDCTSCHQAAGTRAGTELVAFRGGDQIFTDDPLHRTSVKDDGVWWDLRRIKADGWLAGQEPTGSGYTSYTYRPRRRIFRRR